MNLENFWGQKLKILKIRDSYLLALAILPITYALCVVFLNTQFLVIFYRLIRFIPKMACSDVTKTSLS